MRSHLESTRADLPVDQFIQDDLSLSAQILWPVLEADQVLSTRHASMAVVDNGRVMGHMTQTDAKKWLVLHQTHS
jgi:hypothetical protein